MHWEKETIHQQFLAEMGGNRGKISVVDMVSQVLIGFYIYHWRRNIC